MIELLKELQANTLAGLAADERDRRLLLARKVRPRVRAMLAGEPPIPMRKYIRALDQLDAGCLRTNPNWRPWGTGSME